MTSLLNKHTHTRKMKIDERPKKDFNEVEGMLKTLFKKFERSPLSLENLDNVYKDMTGMKEKLETKTIDTRAKSKRHEEKAIFYDIFIKPKENKIKELRSKKTDNFNKTEKKETESRGNIYISNKVSDVDKKDKFLSINNKESLPPSSLASHQKMASNVTEFNVSAMTVKVKQEINLTSNNTNNNSKEDYDLIKLNIASSFKADGDDYTSILLKFLQSKFLPTKSQTGKKNFFNQQIQIQPPEGINAVVASPLVESSKGWAPSIPPMQINKAKTNLGDLMMRAKGGIQAGDIPKEAHMAFYLGIMNEEEKRYEESLKFYKKYFLSTKLLQDIYGMELALNRIGVLYSNIGDFNQSLYYHDKHRNITTHNIKGFVAHYNSGICQRVLGRVDEAIKSFNSALGMAEEENDIESYTLCLCQLSICYLFLGNLNSFIEYSDEFFNKNKTLKLYEMELEMLILSQFIYTFCNNLDAAEDLCKRSLEHSKQLNHSQYKSISICNTGIVEANKDFEEFFNSLD